MSNLFDYKLSYKTILFRYFYNLAFLIFLTLALPLMSNNYFSRFHTLDNGGFSYTGNTLGLSKEVGFNNPGTSDADGAFTVTNSSLSAPSTIPTQWPNVIDPPAGTTLTWQNNSSMAVLDIPPGSTILYAELIWSGSYGFNGQIPFPGNPFIPDVTPITFISPQNISYIISPDPATAQQAVTPGFINMGNYVRSQNVTSIIQSSGAGEYTVGGVPATISGLDNTHNAAGWTLAVAYHNSNMYTSDLTLFVTCEQASNSTPATITGFCAPPAPTSEIHARVFVSSTEGDANKTGDQFKFNGTAVSGPNNPLTNFFASQLNTIVGLFVDANGKLTLVNPLPAVLPDTRGTFGFRNQNASTHTDIVAGRQGIDITSVDVTGLVPTSSTSATIQGTTSGDDYTLSSIGMVIQVGAPILVARKTVNTQTSIVTTVGTIVDFAFTIENVGTEIAFNTIFIDHLETGLSYVPGSFQFNSVTQPDPNLNTGFAVGNIAPTQSVTVSFQAQINNYPLTSSTYENQAQLNYQFTPCSTGPLEALVAATNIVFINFFPVANPDFGTTIVNTPFEGASVLDNDIGTGITVTSHTAPTQGGTVIIFSDGSYLYTPPLNFVGVDTFNYTVTDTLNPSNTASTTVTITVLPTANPPVANNDSGTTAMNTALNGSSVLANDFGNGLVVESYSQSSQGGTVTLNSSTGTYVYVPPLNFVGLDTFTYTDVDIHGNHVSATVTINVTPSLLPYANNDSYVTHVNVPVSGNVLLNDSASITTYVSNTAPSHGSVVFNPLDNGNFTYTPDLNFTGEDAFTYIARDALGNLVAAIVTITVYPDIIPVANPDFGTTPVNTTLDGPSVLTNDVGNVLTVVSYSQGINGGTVIVFPDGTYIYKPPLNYVGIDVFTYTAEDIFGVFVSSTVTITITPLIPPNFFGTIKKCKLLNKSEFSLSATWTASLSPSVVAYRIYNGTTVVETFFGTGVFNYCLRNKSQAKNFSITAVDQFGFESAHTMIRITND